MKWLLDRLSSRLAGLVDAGVFVMYKIYQICRGLPETDERTITPTAAREELWNALCRQHSSDVTRQSDSNFARFTWNTVARGVTDSNQEGTHTSANETQCTNPNIDYESRTHNDCEADSSPTSNEWWHGHSSQLSSPVSSPTEKLRSFHEFGKDLSGVDKIRRIEEICTGRVVNYVILRYLLLALKIKYY